MLSMFGQHVEMAANSQRTEHTALKAPDGWSELRNKQSSQNVSMHPFGL